MKELEIFRFPLVLIELYINTENVLYFSYINFPLCFIRSKVVICFDCSFRRYTSEFKARKIGIGLFCHFGTTCLQTVELSKFMSAKAKVAVIY